MSSVLIHIYLLLLPPPDARPQTNYDCDTGATVGVPFSPTTPPPTGVPGGWAIRAGILRGKLRPSDFQGSAGRKWRGHRWVSAIYCEEAPVGPGTRWRHAGNAGSARWQGALLLGGPASSGPAQGSQDQRSHGAQQHHTLVLGLISKTRNSSWVNLHHWLRKQLLTGNDILDITWFRQLTDEKHGPKLMNGNKTTKCCTMALTRIVASQMLPADLCTGPSKSLQSSRSRCSEPEG